MIVMKPEKKVIPGLKDKAKRLYAELGHDPKRGFAVSIVGGCILALAVCGFEGIHPRFCTAYIKQP